MTISHYQAHGSMPSSTTLLPSFSTSFLGRLPSPCLPRTHLTRAHITPRTLDRGQQDTEKKAAMTNTEGNSWSSWRKALGQRLNMAGIASFISVATKDRNLAVPHLSVPDVRWVDWEALEKAGFRGVVFDKDNTITAPYQLVLWPPLEGTFQRCREVFDGRVAVLSNSAGLYEYDPDGSHARAIERSIQGLHVIRHKNKKPGGGAVEVEKYFGCSASHLIMVGDRYFTDVVYGNQNGCLTILTEPLSLHTEPLIVQQVRKFENYLVNSWCQQGFKPIKHNLLSGSEQFVRDLPL